MKEEGGLSRRDLLRAGLAVGTAAGLGSLAAGCGQNRAAGGSETASVAPFTGTLRVIGLKVDLIDRIKAAAERELGFKLAFEATSSPVMVQRAIAQPASFDLMSGYAYQIDQVWPAGNLIGLDRTRIVRWSEVTPLYKLGKLTAACSVGDGDAPFRKLYTMAVHEPGAIVRWGGDDGSGPQGADEPPGVTGAPSTFNMDSIGYNADVLGLEPGEVSWAELFNQKWRGRVALLNEPTIGLQDSALAAEALGLMTFKDKGNMTREEIDALVKILLDLKVKGHFRAFWTTLDESVNLMASGQVVVESMWWPGVALLQSAGYPTHYAAPPEGYRGWAGSFCVSKTVLDDPSRLGACYDYINWWHSGVPGAILMGYGYYNAVQDASREFVSQDEWDYWIDGKPAAGDLDSPFGQKSIPKGQVRDGGSLSARACRPATWISYFDDEYAHALERWGELTAQ